MTSNRWRRVVTTFQKGELPIYLYNGTIGVEPQNFWLYPAKNMPIIPNRIRNDGYSDNKFIANIQSDNDIARYNKDITNIKNNAKKSNKDNYLKQISHIVRWTLVTDNIWFKPFPTTISKDSIETENNGLSDKQRNALKNYQRSWLYISIPEGQEFFANGNWRDAPIKRYLIKDWYIYETDVKRWWGNGFVKANKYEATPENLKALNKWYDIYNLNRLLDNAKTDEKWKAIFGEDVSDLLPSEIKLTNRVN